MVDSLLSTVLLIQQPKCGQIIIAKKNQGKGNLENIEYAARSKNYASARSISSLEKSFETTCTVLP